MLQGGLHEVRGPNLVLPVRHDCRVAPLGMVPPCMREYSDTATSADVNASTCPANVPATSSPCSCACSPFSPDKGAASPSTVSSDGAPSLCPGSESLLLDSFGSFVWLWSSTESEGVSSVNCFPRLSPGLGGLLETALLAVLPLFMLLAPGLLFTAVLLLLAWLLLALLLLLLLLLLLAVPPLLALLLVVRVSFKEE